MISARILQPLADLCSGLSIDSASIGSRAVTDVVRVIGCLDVAVETGCWSRADRHWRELDLLAGDITRGLGTPTQKELTQLREYEGWERFLRGRSSLTWSEMRRVLYLKSADIGLYRKALLSDNGIPWDSALNSALRAIDILREFTDDLTDVEEDMERPNFNFALYAHAARADTAASLHSELGRLADCATESIRRLASVGTRSSFRHHLERQVDAEVMKCSRLIPAETRRLESLRPQVAFEFSLAT